MIINSLNEYINIINNKILDCKKSNVKISSKIYKLYFRGQSNSNWKLEPSINRTDRRDRDEKKVIDKYYEEYGNISLFQNLSLIQHKESGTRLLDFTKNPLVALYFACNENVGNDGKVYILFFDGVDSIWNKSKLLCYIPSLPIEKEEWTVVEYKEFLMKEEKRFSNYGIDLNSDIIDCVVYGNLVIPIKEDYKINSRLSRQCGVFYLCPPEITYIGEKEKEHINNGYIRLNDNDLKFSRSKVEFPKWLTHRDIEEIQINSIAKHRILKDLYEKYGINEEYLFPSL